MDNTGEGNTDDNGNTNGGGDQKDTNGGNDIDNTNTGINTDDRNTNDDVQGGLLPATASNTPLLMLIGILMATAGSVLIFRRKKSLNETLLDD